MKHGECVSDKKKKREREMGEREREGGINIYYKKEGDREKYTHSSVQF